jgi:hypothetical protein
MNRLRCFFENLVGDAIALTVPFLLWVAQFMYKEEK